jgi:hypothetical protein
MLQQSVNTVIRGEGTSADSVRGPSLAGGDRMLVKHSLGGGSIPVSSDDIYVLGHIEKQPYVCHTRAMKQDYPC